MPRAKKGSMFIEIENGVLLRRALRKAAVDMKDLSAINRRAAAVVAAEARKIAPVGDDKGGHIAVTIRPGATQRAGIVRVGNASKPYAGVIHYGWRAKNVKKVKPWVIISAQKTEPIWVNQYYQEIKEIIERIG